ncbi:MAG: dihydrodipicolinate synthetase [Conexibacter sp.]|nr:dihydrodipicolinate synthetase [Conexibacter sp.]
MPVEGILPVIPTPFRDGQFDRTSFERLLEHMLPHVDGYTLLGSTGEAPSMTTEQRQEIAEFALAATPSDKAVVVGVTHTSINDALAVARHAQEHGAAAVLCASPFYFANSSSGIRSYLMQLDRVLEVDLVFYDNPAATKTQIKIGDPIDWAEHVGSLKAVKLTDHDLTKVEAWQRAGLRVFGGDDPIAFRYIAAGVDGMMIIAPALCPEPFRRVWDHARAGDLGAAFGVFSTEIAPVLHVFGIGDEIATTKAIFGQRGLFESAELLPPLERVTPERERLLAIADDLVRVQSEKRRAAIPDAEAVS